MNTRVIATVVSVALAVAVGIPAALADVGGNGPADNQTVDDGSQVLTFSTPYYVVEVPTDRSPYITFEYEEGISADKAGVDKNPYATHSTHVQLSDIVNGTSEPMIYVSCIAGVDDLDGPLLHSDTGITTPDGLHVFVSVVRGTGVEPDPESVEMLKFAESCVKPIDGGEQKD